MTVLLLNRRSGLLRCWCRSRGRDRPLLGRPLHWLVTVARLSLALLVLLRLWSGLLLVLLWLVWLLLLLRLVH